MNNTFNELYFEILDESPWKSIAAAGLLGASSLAGNAEAMATVKPQIERTLKQGDIDIDKIAYIESKNNPKAENRKSKARGLCQIHTKAIWDEQVKFMGQNWSWDEAWDGEKNKAVAEYYINTRIPKMLRSYKIPDTQPNRIAAYNWGIGNLRNNYNKYAEEWVQVAPKETLDYLEKYFGN